jgi:hypothetical protein
VSYMMGPQTRRCVPMTWIEKLLWLPQGFLRRMVHLCTSCWCAKYMGWMLNCSALELAVGMLLEP